MTEINMQTKYDKVMRALLLCIIWYIEFAVRYFQIPNTLLFLGGLLFIFFLLDYFSGGRESILPLSKSIVFLFAYEFYTIVFGLVVAPEISPHIQQSINMIEYTIPLIAIVYYAKKNKNIEFLIWNYALLYTLMCIIFLLKPVWYLDDDRYRRLSFAATMNPNSFGICMVTGTWAILYLTSQKKIPMLFSFILTALFAYSIFLSGSRKGIIGIVIVFFLWIYFGFIRNTDKGQLPIRLLKILMSVVLVVILYRLLFPYYSSSIVSFRMQNLTEETSSGARMEMYRRGWEYFKESPLFGYGLQGFRYFYGGYSHATIVEVPVSGGIIGAFIYFLYNAEILIELFHAMRATNRELADHIAYTRPRMGLILYVVMLFYSIAMIHIYEISSYMYYGMIISTAVYTQSNQLDEEVVEAPQCRYFR